MSRLIKSGWANPEQVDKRVISIKTIVKPVLEEEFVIEQSIQKNFDDLIAEAESKATFIVKQANEEAERIRQQIEFDHQQWEQQKQQLINSAHNEGYEHGIIQGREHGCEQGLLEFQQLIQTAREVVAASKIEYQKQVESSDQAILNIALSVVEKILNQKLEEREQFLPIVKRALKEAKDYREVQLHIHPSHYGFLLSQKDELMGLFPRETDFYLYPDDSLGEWSCIIESTNGRIDASIDSQLNEIKQKLLEILESE